MAVVIPVAVFVVVFVDAAMVATVMVIVVDRDILCWWQCSCSWPWSWRWSG